MKPLLTILVVTLLMSPLAAHAWQPNGVPLSTALWATSPRVISDGAGGAIAVWSNGQDIFAQRIDGSGVVLWNAAGVPVCTALDVQSNPSIASDGAGGAIIAWNDRRDGADYNIYAQRIDATGAALWSPDGNRVATAFNDQIGSMIVADGSGGAIIGWNDFRNGTDYDIYAQRMDASGNPLWPTDGVPLSATTGDQADNVPLLVSDGSGGAIVTWQDGRSGVNYDIYAQRVDGSGNVQWTTNGVALCTAVGLQEYGAITSDGSGGAIVAWEDYRNGNDDIYAQRVDVSGTPQWTADGVALCTAPNEQVHPLAVPDGSGGVIVAWGDYRNGTDYNVYAQRVSAAGLVQWTADGVAVCNAAQNQEIPFNISDGSGGAIVVWPDERNGARDIYAQRVDALGNAVWAPNGVVVCDAANDQSFPLMVLDGSGGAIVAWQDERSGVATQAYAQRLELTYGSWGYPAPTTTSVADIPGDQGGYVALNWLASGRDVVNQQLITYYSIWRATDAVAAEAATSAGTAVKNPSGVPEDFQGKAVWIQHRAATDYYWEWIGNQDAHHFSAYSFSAPTRGDSTSQGTMDTHFLVSAQTGDPSVYFDSNVMTGHSVDNLAPSAPLYLVAQRNGADVDLHWNAVTAPDLKDYTLYRATASGVTPVSGNFLSSATDTAFVDANAPTTVLYYIVTATDVHENQSGASNEASVSGATGVGHTPALTALSVQPNVPNPFAASTDLEIGLPSAGPIGVTVYDVAGRRVRTLAVPGGVVGWQRVRLEAVDDAGRPLASGVYFYRVSWEGKMVTRKMVIAR